MPNSNSPVEKRHRPLHPPLASGGWTGRPGVLWFMGSQRVGHVRATELNWTDVALCGSKAHHRLGSESVSWCLETSLFLRLPSRDRAPSLPLWSLFWSFIFFLPPFEYSGLLFWVPVSSAGIQKLFCGIYSAFKCSFNEFVWEKVVSPSYSSAIFRCVF